MHAIKIAILALSLCCCSLAHRDPSYYRSANDGFNFGRNRWMERICDNVMLSELALPGTHDSGAYLGRGGDISTTQCLSFDQQLATGVRVFDIRIRHIDNVFTLHHGVVYLGINFGQFLTSVRNFLSTNPSETVLFRLKEEHSPGGGNARSMRETLEWYMNENSAWYLKTTDPRITLGQARGKFIILIDNLDFLGLGLVYSSMNIQDEWRLGTNWDLYRKWQRVEAQLTNAINGPNHQWYMNYLSGAGGSFPYFVASGHMSPGTSASRLSTGRTTPGWRNSWLDFPRVNCFIGICTIAFEGTNTLTRNRIRHFNQNRSGSRTVGIIMADFPGDDLVDQIIGNNNRICRN